MVVWAQWLRLCLISVRVTGLSGLKLLVGLLIVLLLLRVVVSVALVNFPQSTVKVILTVPCDIFVDFCLVYVCTAKALCNTAESAVGPTRLPPIVVVVLGRLFAPPFGVDHAIDGLTAGASFVRFGSLFILVRVVDLVSRLVSLARVRAIATPAPA